MSEIVDGSIVNKEKYELVIEIPNDGYYDEYDVYYNSDTDRIVLENSKRVIESDSWRASYTGDVTHRDASYCNA